MSLSTFRLGCLREAESLWGGDAVVFDVVRERWDGLGRVGEVVEDGGEVEVDGGGGVDGCVGGGVDGRGVAGEVVETWRQCFEVHLWMR